MRGPRLEAVEDVRRVHYARAAFLRLGAQVCQQIGAAKHVQVHCDLVEQQHLPQFKLRLKLRVLKGLLLQVREGVVRPCVAYRLDMSALFRQSTSRTL